MGARLTFSPGGHKRRCGQLAAASTRSFAFRASRRRRVCGTPVFSCPAGTNRRVEAGHSPARQGAISGNLAAGPCDLHLWRRARDAAASLENRRRPERQTDPAGHVSGTRNLGSAISCFPATCAEVSGKWRRGTHECVRHACGRQFISASMSRGPFSLMA